MIIPLNFNDIKKDLRKMDFPFTVRESIKKADELLRSMCHGWGQTECHMEFISELISEFVFNETTQDRRIKRKQLSHVDELSAMLTVLEQIVDEDCCQSTSVRNSLLLLLFPSDKPQRSRFLVLLTSLALSCCSAPVLDSTAALLQQVGFGSGFSRHFANSLMEGYFLLAEPRSDNVRRIPLSAPLFAANFITALTEAQEHNGVQQEPSVQMTALFIEWLRVSKTFVLSPLVSKYRASLLPASVAMLSVTPHASILRWWALGWSGGGGRHADLYSELEALVLDSLHVCRDRLDSTAGLSVLTGSDMLSVLTVLNESAAAVRSAAVDRFAHVLSVTLQTNTLFIDSQDFWQTLSSRVPTNTSDLLNDIVAHNTAF